MMKMRPALIAVFAASGLVNLAAPSLADEKPAPWSQAAPFYDREAFARSRRALIKEHGGQAGYFVLGERLEYQSNEGSPLLLFDGQGWWGTDRNKLWIKSEIEYEFEADRFEEAEIQALWSRPIARYFDFQAGVRHDFEPDPSRSFGVIGVQGLAPYWFDVDGALFVSGDGDVSARIEAEYDLLLTQRLILQPRMELNFAVQSVDELNVGSGLSNAELGLRLRYEVSRQFAPYVGVSWTRSVGETADFVRADGEDPGALSFVAGLRFWF
jgi:copper resistance protein B